MKFERFNSKKNFTDIYISKLPAAYAVLQFSVYIILSTSTSKQEKTKEMQNCIYVHIMSHSHVVIKLLSIMHYAKMPSLHWSFHIWLFLGRSLGLIQSHTCACPQKIIFILCMPFHTLNISSHFCNNQWTQQLNAPVVQWPTCITKYVKVMHSIKRYEIGSITYLFWYVLDLDICKLTTCIKLHSILRPMIMW